MMGSVPETVLALALSWKTDCLGSFLVQDALSMLRLFVGGFCRNLNEAFVPFLAEYEAFGHVSTFRMMLWLFSTKIYI